MKKLIALVLSFCVISSVFSFSASAIATYGDYEYTVLSDGTCKLVEYIGENGNKGELIIPSEIDGFTVSAIDSGLLYNCHESYMKITSLVIPGTVKHTSSAFHGCRNLKELIISNGVEVIDNCAFQGAFQLEKIEIPDSVISIGKSAFEFCQITEFRIPKNLKEIPERFLYGCEKITHIDIPNSVVSIGKDAFFGAGLKGVRIPSSVEKIADGAFVRNDENLIIYAHADSVAKDYAAKKGILFKGLKCFCESNRPTEQIIKAVESTCTQKGMSEGKYCTECGEITVKPRETELLPHKAKWVVTKNSTYFGKGEKVYKCEDCDKILEYKTTDKKRLVTPELNVKADKSAFKVTYKRVKDATGFQVRYRKGNTLVVKTFDKNKKKT